jgi:hypothetical protein
MPKRILALSTSRKNIDDDTAGIAVGVAKTAQMAFLADLNLINSGTVTPLT